MDFPGDMARDAEDRITCGRCDGSGYADPDAMAGDACPECNGEGSVPEWAFDPSDAREWELAVRG